MVILGPPGAGKGTYASRLMRILNIPHISTGDIVRCEAESNSELGKKVKEYSEKGELVPDTIIIDLVLKRLRRKDVIDGFILDGFPRTLAQAKALDKSLKIDLVINLAVPDQILITRLSNRIVCNNCGEIYNLMTLKPKQKGICGKCGGELIQRKDDKANIIQERLNIYRRKTKPLIAYFQEKGVLKSVECTDLLMPPEEIVQRIVRLVKDLKI